MRRWGRLIFYLIMIGVIFQVGSKLFGSSSQSFSFNFQNTLGLVSDDSQTSPLKPLVDKHLSDMEGEFAVYIKDLEGKEYDFAQSADKQFPSASLYKLVVMAAVMRDVEQGKYSLDDEVSASKEYLEGRLGGVDFGYKEVKGQIGYPISEAMRRVAAISDNFAAIMLTDRIDKAAGKAVEGSEELNNYAKELDMNQTHFGEDGITTTAYDIGVFYEKLYKKEIVSPSSSERIIEWLAKSQLNNRIPAKLPKEIKVAHKTGELARIRHDAGIVYLEGRPYVIVLMSQDIKYEDSVAESFANVSEEIFKFFVSNREKISP